MTGSAHSTKLDPPLISWLPSTDVIEMKPRRHCNPVRYTRVVIMDTRRMKTRTCRPMPAWLMFGDHKFSHSMTRTAPNRYCRVVRLFVRVIHTLDSHLDRTLVFTRIKGLARLIARAVSCSIATETTQMWLWTRARTHAMAPMDRKVAALGRAATVS